jgi:hypothetical protein
MKLKAKCRFKSFELDFKTYKKVAFNAVVNINETAGKTWIRAATDEAPIPTWSGASRASFQKLARDLGTSVPLGPIRERGNLFDRIAWGRQSSKGSGLVTDKGKVYLGFIYQTTLGHLIYNEYNSPVPGPYPQPWTTAVRFTPYFFQYRAWEAWNEVAKTAKLPNPYNYLVKKKM